MRLSNVSRFLLLATNKSAKTQTQMASIVPIFGRFDELGMIGEVVIDFVALDGLRLLFATGKRGNAKKGK